jgi:secondary thiamine-phosphate synthase enzyme
LRQATHTISTETNGPGLYDITRSVLNWCSQQGIQEGLLTLFIKHTSASLTIQENADPDVCHDLQDFFSRIAPNNGPYRHSAEGPDDMPAHIKTALTQTQLTIPVQGGRPVLGTWQGVYLFEHRDRRHQRRIVMHLLGD